MTQAAARRRPGSATRGRAAAAGRAPRRVRAGAPLRVRGRGRAALPRLDLASQHPRARGRRRRRDGRADRSRSSSARGKMHNPETDSGGVLLGTVAAVGERYESRPRRATGSSRSRSLTLTPLRLDVGERLDPGSPQVEVTGTAYVCDRAAWAPVPDDLPLATRARDLRRLRAPPRRPARWRRTTARSACWAPGTRASWRSPPRATRWRAGPWSPSTSTRGAIDRVCGARPLRHRRDGRPARPARRDRGAAGRRRAAGRPDRGRRQRRPAASRPRSCSPPTRARCCSSRWRRASPPRRWRPTGSARASACWSAAATRRTAAPTRSTWCAARSRCARPGIAAAGAS